MSVLPADQQVRRLLAVIVGFEDPGPFKQVPCVEAATRDDHVGGYKKVLRDHGRSPEIGRPVLLHTAVALRPAPNVDIEPKAEQATAVSARAGGGSLKEEATRHVCIPPLAVERERSLEQLVGVADDERRPPTVTT